MKLFTYTDAIGSRQYTMTTQVSDETMTITGGRPRTMRAHPPATASARWSIGLGNSLNLPAVRTEYALGCSPSPTWPSTPG